MRRSSLALLLLLTACSSSTRTATLGSPGPVPPTTPSSTPAPSSPAAQSLPTPSLTPSPAARRTASAASAATSAGRPSLSPSPRTSPARAGRTFAVSQVTGYRFSPSSLTLRSGDGVLVTNTDLATHTFTITQLGVDSGSMAQGDTFRYTFRAPGDYRFVCTPHQSLGMTGTLTVTP